MQIPRHHRVKSQGGGASKLIPSQTPQYSKQARVSPRKLKPKMGDEEVKNFVPEDSIFEAYGIGDKSTN